MKMGGLQVRSEQRTPSERWMPGGAPWKSLEYELRCLRQERARGGHGPDELLPLLRNILRFCPGSDAPCSVLRALAAEVLGRLEVQAPAAEKNHSHTVVDG